MRCLLVDEVDNIWRRKSRGERVKSYEMEISNNLQDKEPHIFGEDRAMVFHWERSTRQQIPEKIWYMLNRQIHGERRQRRRRSKIHVIGEESGNCCDKIRDHCGKVFERSTMGRWRAVWQRCLVTEEERLNSTHKCSWKACGSDIETESRGKGCWTKLEFC